MFAVDGGHLAVIQYIHSQGASLTDKDDVSKRVNNGYNRN